MTTRQGKPAHMTGPAPVVRPSLDSQTHTHMKTQTPSTKITGNTRAIAGAFSLHKYDAFFDRPKETRRRRGGFVTIISSRLTGRTTVLP